MRKLIIHNHLPKRRTVDANQAYKIKVRRIQTGADFNIRIFAASQADAEERAKERARSMDKIPLDKYREALGKGIGIFRIVSSELDPDQSRPSYDRRARDVNAFEHAVPRGQEERNRDKMYKDAGIKRIDTRDGGWPESFKWDGYTWKKTGKTGKIKTTGETVYEYKADWKEPGLRGKASAPVVWRLENGMQTSEGSVAKDSRDGDSSEGKWGEAYNAKGEKVRVWIPSNATAEKESRDSDPDYDKWVEEKRRTQNQGGGSFRR